MGYNIRQIGGDFHLPRENYDDALTALRDLMTRKDLMRGGSSSGDRWFAFCNRADPNGWTTVVDALRDLRYDAAEDESGVVALTFTGEKLGDDRTVLESIGRFVRPGSTMVFLGEDGARWTWVFQPDGSLAELL